MGCHPAHSRKIKVEISPERASLITNFVAKELKSPVRISMKSYKVIELKRENDPFEK